MKTFLRSAPLLGLFGALLCLSWGSAEAARRAATARTAAAGEVFQLGTSVDLRTSATDIPLLCFDSLLTSVLSPACFQTDISPGDCVSSSQHFFVQLFDPIDYFGSNFPETYWVTGMAFITNDGATTFPSAGVVVKPYDPNNFFPTAEELANLQVSNIVSPHDTAIVFLDLTSAAMTFTRDDVLFVCLQFPEGGKLNAPFDGPGIAVDPSGEDPRCDFFTLTAGTPMDWFEPAAGAVLDWGFEVDVEVTTAVETLTWSRLKRFYRDP